MKSPKILTSLIAAVLFVIPSVASALEVGDNAPNFTTQSTAGSINLEEYAGRKNVVLALFYYIDTSV